MMLKMLLPLGLMTQLLAEVHPSGTAVVPGDETYYTVKTEKPDLEMIYTQQNSYAAEEALSLEPMINAEYEHFYGYAMDAPLHVGIISQQNQIANGFSTQFPLNMQINYIGGALKPDYFATTSWLNTLLYHETAHNYQVNPKASPVSQGLHSVLGNSLILLGLFPVITVPNAFLTSYTLEGNAVLNESWQGNGGRLYSGRFKAESILQAKAGHITPQFLFNQTIHEFPYYDRHYLIGGFFQLYLAEKYGLEKTNRFFYNHSRSWLWPFRTNHIYRLTFGESFEDALAGYNRWLLEQADGFVEAEGKTVATSMYFTSLNNNCDTIYFLTSDAQRAPELVRLFKHDKAVKKERGSYLQGKVINRHDTYATIAANHTDPTRITQGLFDDSAQILEGTQSRLIQGYLKDGVAVYFDLPTSFIAPQLYVGDQFYAQVNSSVYIDTEDNLYYFVQEGKKRTLYKNREALYTLNDYYGIVSDVDRQGRIYFVANSEKGSSLYRLDRGVVERVSDADNVVEARLVNDDEVLIAAIGQANYYYVIAPLESRPEAPHETTFFFEDEPYFEHADFADFKDEDAAGKLKTGEKYYAPLNLHYAGTSIALGAQDNALTYAVIMDLEDPLLTNRFNLYAMQGADRVGLAGAGYRNDAHRINFGGNIYGVYNTGDPLTLYDYNATTNTYSDGQTLTQESRDYGFSAFAALPIIRSGFNRVDLSVDYYQDYDANARSPFIVTADAIHAEHYGQAVDFDDFNALSVFGASDRGDLSGGLTYKYSHGLPWKMFAGLGLKGVRSDYDRDPSVVPDDADATRGVKFSPYQSPIFNDATTVVMPSLEHTRYVKQAGVGEVNLKKQFDGRILFFTFPLSLTREVVYARYRYYDIQDFGQANDSGHTIYNETAAGLTLELLLLNGLSLPLTMEYIYNDNTAEANHFRFLIGGVF